MVVPLTVKLPPTVTSPVVVTAAAPIVPVKVGEPARATAPVPVTVEMPVPLILRTFPVPAVS